MKNLVTLSLILTLVGALNWGLVTAFDLNLVSTLFGSNPQLERIVYILIGLSALYSFSLVKPMLNGTCSSKK